MLCSGHPSHQLLIRIRSTYNLDLRAYAIPDYPQKKHQEMMTGFFWISHYCLCLSTGFGFFSLYITPAILFPAILFTGPSSF
jgi:hypothetical protein